MKGAWHYWMEQFSSDYSTANKIVRSDYIPYGLKIYAHVSLSAYAVYPAFTGIAEARVYITAYGKYTAPDSWHTEHLHDYRNFIFREDCAWVEASLEIFGGKATASLSIVGY